MIHIAVMGFGTVGAGVAEILQTNGALLEKRLGEAVALKYILDIRDFPDSPFGALVVHDFETIVNDPEVDVVVETIGGTGVAYEYTRRAQTCGHLQQGTGGHSGAETAGAGRREKHQLSV